MAEKNLKKYSASLVIREIQIKLTLRFHLIPMRMAKIKIQVTAYAVEEAEKEEHFFVVGGRQFVGFSDIWE